MEQYLTILNNGKVESHTAIRDLPADAHMMIKSSCHTSINKREKAHAKFNWLDMKDAEELNEGAFIIPSEGAEPVLFDANIYDLDKANVINGKLKAIINYSENTYFDKYTGKFEPIKNIDK